MGYKVQVVGQDRAIDGQVRGGQGNRWAATG